MNRILIPFVWLVLLGSRAFAEPLMRDETISVTGPKSISIPFVVSAHNQLFAILEVSGRKLRMLVDTGGPDTSIDKALAEALGIKSEGGDRRVAMGGSVVSDAGAHVDVRLGEFLVHKCPIHLLDLSATKDAIVRSGFEPFDGFLGVDMLLFLGAKVDFGHRTIQLYRP